MQLMIWLDLTFNHDHCSCLQQIESYRNTKSMWPYLTAAPESAAVLWRIYIRCFGRSHFLKKIFEYHKQREGWNIFSKDHLYTAIMHWDIISTEILDDDHSRDLSDIQRSPYLNLIRQRARHATIAKQPPSKDKKKNDSKSWQSGK